MTDAKWIEFEELSQIGKTQRWRVNSIGAEDLGTIKWHGAWHQYAFFPAPATLFERQCLRDIADFCESETGKRRKLPKLSAEQKAEAR